MLSYIQENKDRFLNELLDLLRIPSVSTDANHKNDMLKTAQFLSQKFQEAGVDKVEICPTNGHPVVYAEKILGENLPTVLVYGHYDVQPADPLELWTSPPFEPVIKDEKIYARGACDDKGQMYLHVKAFETLLKTNQLACNVKFMIEGEEEIGSVHLGDFIKENKEKLKADCILISDTSMFANDIPSITVGLRGLAYLQVEVTGTNRDLHSGVYGGAVPNPINVLCEMIAKLKDADNKVTIPHFYDKVLELSTEQRAEMAQVPFDIEAYKAHLDLSDVMGEAGYSPMEHTSIRPTLDANGIWGGYIQEGAKTVIPSKAYAKISMRLVPHQDPEEIAELFEKYFMSIAPPSVKVKITPHHGGLPYLTDQNLPAYKAALSAYEKSFGKKAIQVRAGGSIPILSLFRQELGLDSILMGFGLDSDAIHSPNEHFGIFNYFKGIETICHFYKILGNS